MPALRLFRRDVWHFAKRYWSSEERWSAWLLLGTVVALNLGLVYANVLINRANGALFNALEQHDANGFYAAFGSVLLLIMTYLAAAVLRAFLDQTLQLRWRRWLTDQYLTRWLSGHAFYRMRFTGQVDNPDQRISEDVRLFIERTMSLGLGLMSSVATLGAFAAILWQLSGSVAISLLGTSISVPGHMVWIAVAYAGIGSAIAHLVGRSLIRLNYRQQKVEADFRFALVRLREQAEGIALYGGEAQERRVALRRFRALYRNFHRLIVCNTRYLLYQLLVSQLAYFFGLFVAAPRYFSGAIQLGPMMKAVNAFERVNESLSWFIGSYPEFAQWRATIERLDQLGREIRDVSGKDPPGARIEAGTGASIELDRLRVELPDGTPLLKPVSLRLERGEATLLHGATGSGKSTLFRVLAGLWPFASGRVRVPVGARMLFLPQRPYMPIGSLRDTLWFPGGADPQKDHKARRALAAAGLRMLAERLDEEAHWSQVLSVGEQQRVAIARALLLKPDWLFLDEATSAMSEQEEAGLYCALVEGLPATTIVSIGHRRSLEAWHPRVIKIEGDSLVRVRRAKPQGRSSELDRAGTEDGSFSPETSG